MQASQVDERLILMVDPNASHSHLMSQVLQERSSPCRLISVPAGRAALDFLHQRGEYVTAERPHLILLDLNLPDHDGLQVLTEIKADPRLRRIPIIVLTTSDAPADVFRCYVEQGNCYVVKAADYEQLSLSIKQIEAFWLEIVTLPQE